MNSLARFCLGLARRFRPSLFYLFDFVDQVVSHLRQLVAFRCISNSVCLPPVEKIQISHRVVVLRPQFEGAFQRLDALVDLSPVFARIFFPQIRGKRRIVAELPAPHGQIELRPQQSVRAERECPVNDANPVVGLGIIGTEINVFLMVRLRLFKEIRIEGRTAHLEQHRAQAVDRGDVLWLNVQRPPEFPNCGVAHANVIFARRTGEVLGRVSGREIQTCIQKLRVELFCVREIAFRLLVLSISESLNALIQILPRLFLFFGLSRFLLSETSTRHHPRQSQHRHGHQEAKGTKRAYTNNTDDHEELRSSLRSLILLFVARGRNLEDGEESFLRNVHLDDALQFKSSVNLTAVANVRDSDGLVGVINLVEDAVIAEANPPALALRQLLASCRPGILAKGVDLVLSNAELLRRQIDKFFLGSRQDEKVVAHFRERFISVMAWSNGMGVSPDASASSKARMSSSSSSSSRIFSYSSMLRTTATFSPRSFTTNWRSFPIESLPEHSLLRG